MKSLNESSYNVVEISNQEMAEINGGIGILEAAALIVGIVVGIEQLGEAAGKAIYYATH